jgi:hypothetical protein
MGCRFAVVAVLVIGFLPSVVEATPASARGTTGGRGSKTGTDLRLAKRSSPPPGTDRRSGPGGTGTRGRAGDPAQTEDDLIDQRLSTDAQLMFESLRASRGESPNAAKIERVSAEVRAEAKRKKTTPTSVWKDPFAEDPEKPIPVYLSGRPAGRASAAKDSVPMNGSKNKELVVVRRELARARAETAVAQADAAKAQADAARAKANAARVEATAAQVQATAARQEAVAARAACVAPSDRKKAATLAGSGSPIGNSNASLIASSGSTRNANPVRNSKSLRSARSRDGFEEFAQGSRGRNGRRGRGIGPVGSGSDDPFMSSGEQDGQQDGAGELEAAPPEEEPAPAAPLAASRGIVVVPIGPQ